MDIKLGIIIEDMVDIMEDIINEALAKVKATMVEFKVLVAKDISNKFTLLNDSNNYSFYRPLAINQSFTVLSNSSVCYFNCL